MSDKSAAQTQSVQPLKPFVTLLVKYDLLATLLTIFTVLTTVTQSVFIMIMGIAILVILRWLRVLAD